VTDLYALILAGGRGTRFWPCSRRQTPKQCISIAGRQSYLQQTIDRLRPIIPEERILIVTGREMEGAVREVVSGIPNENLLVEPYGRNTAPCIGWGAVEIGRRAPNALMAVFPSDHQIQDAPAFRGVVTAAAAAARATNALITMGISPTRAETGFGYLEVGVFVGEWHGNRFQTVERFTEKPAPDTAERYLKLGNHLWNAGMFLFRADAIRDAFRSYLPGSAEALARIQQNPKRLEEEWGNLEATSIDYGVMERSRHLLTVPCDFGWSDMGSWQAAADEMPIVPGGRGLALEVVARDASNCVVHAPKKLVALLGVEDLVIVDTPDALLIMHADRAQQVGEVVRHLDASDLSRFT
jgi:mannose-1-phosphate guanylyltransferase